MAWDRNAGTAAKYRSPEHRRARAAMVRQLERDGYLDCTAKVCVFDGEPITNPNGNDPDGLHAGHEDDGVTYAGPQHNLCNVKDGARRGNRRSRGLDAPRFWRL